MNVELCDWCKKVIKTKGDKNTVGIGRESSFFEQSRICYDCWSVVIDAMNRCKVEDRFKRSDI